MPVKKRGAGNPRFKYYYIIAMVSIVSILTMSVILYLVMRQTLVEKRIIDSANSLLSVMKTQDAILNQAERTLSVIGEDPNIANYQQIDIEQKQMEIYDAYNSLARLCRENEFYNKIVVYYYDSGRVLATNWGVSSLADYELNNGPLFTRDLEQRDIVVRTLPPEEGESTGIIEMIRYLPINYVARPKAILSISISSEYFKSLHNLMNSVGGDYFLTNSSRELIYGSLTPIPPDIFEKLEATRTGDGVVYYTIQDTGGLKQLVSQVRSPKYDLIYTSRIPVKQITKDLDFLFSFILFSTALMIVLCAMGVTVTLIRMYRPLDGVADLLTEIGEGTAFPKRPDPREMARKIRGLYEQNKTLLSRNKDMEALFEQNKRNQKNQFLRDLLDDGLEQEELARGLSYYGIPFTDSLSYCVILFSIDDYSRYRADLPAMDRSLFELYLMETMGQELDSNLPFPFVFETVEKGGREFMFILGAGDGQLLCRKAALSAVSLNKRIVQETGVSATLGVSEALAGLSGLKESFIQAKRARDQRWMRGFGLVYFHEAEKAEPGQTAYPYAIEKNLLNALRSNQKEEAPALLERFYESVMTACGTNVSMVQHCFLQILSDTYRCVYESYGVLSGALPPEKEMYSEFLSAPTAEISYQRLVSFYSFVFEQVDRACSQRYNLLSEQVKDYIELHYAKELSVDHLADRFNLSSSHLRRIFKEKTGESLKTYIDSVRMRKAGELLTQADKPIVDVAAMVGYVSQQTFMRVFKKEYGFTPGEFRKVRHNASRKENAIERTQ